MLRVEIIELIEEGRERKLKFAQINEIYTAADLDVRRCL